MWSRTTRASLRSPFAWEDSVQKFDRLATDCIGDSLSREIKEAARALQRIQVKDLMEGAGRATFGGAT
jgi:2-methylcitrate dehydratase